MTASVTPAGNGQGADVYHTSPYGDITGDAARIVSKVAHSCAVLRMAIATYGVAQTDRGTHSKRSHVRCVRDAFRRNPGFEIGNACLRRCARPTYVWEIGTSPFPAIGRSDRPASKGTKTRRAMGHGKNPPIFEARLQIARRLVGNHARHAPGICCGHHLGIGWERRQRFTQPAAVPNPQSSPLWALA